MGKLLLLQLSQEVLLELVVVLVLELKWVAQ
jgi:hypothetical protein